MKTLLINLSCLIISTLSFSGCSTIIDPVTTDLKQPEVSPGTAAAFLNKDLNSRLQTKVEASTDKKLKSNEMDELIAIVASAGDNAQKQAMGALLIKASDEACYEYLTKISTTEKTLRSGFGVSGILLSAASSLTTPVRNANLLAGLSTASQGVEDELSTSILGGQDGDLLVQAVRKGRKKERQILADLLEGKAKTGTQKEVLPSFTRFLMEFPTYHDSCGISYGRQVLRNAVNAASASGEDVKTADVNTGE